MDFEEFSRIKNFQEFEKHYFYKKDLIEICSRLKIKKSGTKKDLEESIKNYFNGNILKEKKSSPKNNTQFSKKIDLNTPILECNFSFNKAFRELFSKLTNNSNFNFTSHMAASLRKVKETSDYNFTINDMLKVYYGDKSYCSYDNSCCLWNKFLKDFCADTKNKDLPNKLKSAAFLWDKVKNEETKKVYSPKLREKFDNELMKIR